MKKIFNKIDKILLLITIIFVILGLLMIFSASSVRALIVYGTSYQFLIKQIIFILLGIFVFLTVIKIPTKNYGVISVAGLSAVFGLLLALLLYGSFTNSSRSWFYIGGFGIQPSELAKVVLIVFTGYFYGKNYKSINKNNIYLTCIPLVVAAILAAFVILQPDFGTAVIMLGIIFFIFISLPISKIIKYKIVGFALSLVFLIVGVVLFSGGSVFSSRQMSRFDYTNPCERYTESNGTGYQVCNGYIAINTGGFFGKGIGQSTQKFLYLPEAHTDFIFCIIVEELGLITGIGILLLYVLMIFRIYKIAKKCNKLSNSIICYGVATYITLHIVINLIGVLGIAPLTGVPLPFLSYGGSFFLSLVLAISIVQRIAYENNVYYEKKIIKSR